MEVDKKCVLLGPIKLEFLQTMDSNMELGKWLGG